MTKFEELINSINTSLDGLMTAETPDADIQKIVAIKEQVSQAQTEQKKLADDYVDIKGRYIEGLKTFGTKELPQEEKPARSFEELAKEIASQNN